MSSTHAPEGRRLWTAAVLAFVALEGAALQLRGAAVPVLERTFGAPAWQLGLVAPAGTVGFTLLAAAVGAAAGRYRVHRLFLFGVIGTAAGVALMGLAPSFPLFLAALLGQGSMSGVGRGSDRPLLSHLYPASRGRLFSYYDMTWAVGAAAGPLVLALALSLGDWRLAFLGLGAAFLPVAALVGSLPAPSIEGDEPLSLVTLRRVLGRPPVVAMAVGLALTVGVEGGLFTWLTTFAVGRLSPSLAPVVLSVLLVAYIPGRFLAGRLVDRLDYVPLALALSVACLLATLYTFYLAAGLELLAGLFAVGFSLSGLYPTLLAYATEAVPEHSAALNALALVVGAGAIAGVPFVMGFVIDAAGILPAMRLLVFPLGALVLVVAAVTLRERTSSG